MDQDNLNIDIEKLLAYCHSTAEFLLVQQEEFYPFAAYINNDTIVIPASFYDADEFPVSDTIIRRANEYFEKKINAAEIRAYAIAYDIRVKNERFPEFIDAICINILHRSNNKRVNYYIPYRLNQKKIQFYDAWMEHTEKLK